MKKIHTAVTLIIIFFMVAALYICGRYENVPDRIFTGKVSAPEGEWTINASDGVTKAEITNLKLQRIINGCVAYCVFSIIALVLFYYGNVVSYSYLCCNGICLDRCRGKESAGADPLC